MQPSEIAKITLPLFACWWIGRSREPLNEWTTEVGDDASPRTADPLGSINAKCQVTCATAVSAVTIDTLESPALEGDQ